MKNRQPPSRSLSRRPTTLAPAVTADPLRAVPEQWTGYGEGIVATPSRQLQPECDERSSWCSRSRIVRPAEYVPDEPIVASPMQQLPADYGRGFDRRDFFYSLRLVELSPAERTVNALRSQLPSRRDCPELIH